MGEHKQSNCIRCGTCCKKGGPSFHLEDKNLIEKGIILSKYIYTIREGEPAFDNVQGRLLTATIDIIKIKGGKHSWTCIFFDEDDNNCKIWFFSNLVVESLIDFQRKVA